MGHLCQAPGVTYALVQVVLDFGGQQEPVIIIHYNSNTSQLTIGTELQQPWLEPSDLKPWWTDSPHLTHILWWAPPLVCIKQELNYSFRRKTEKL